MAENGERRHLELMYTTIVKKVFQGVIEQAENEDEKEVVIYGLEAILSNSVNLLVMIIIGCISHNLLETVIYLLCFCSIRVLAGGFHANTYLTCLLSSVCIYSFIVGINFYVSMKYNIVLIIMAAVSYIAILGLAPILNGKRTFSTEEIRTIKKKVKLILAIELFVTIILYQINFELYKFAIYAIIAEGVLGTMGKIKYWKFNKNTFLKNIMSLSMGVALLTGWIPCLFSLHEPEMPKALKDKLEK
jgi:accessory gene regulator B